MREYISKFIILASIVTILASLIGCSQTRALSKLEKLILEDSGDVHCKSKAICCIESVDYEKNHEDFANIIFNSGDLHLINELVEYFPNDFRNHIIKGDAYVKNAMMQQMLGIFMESSAKVSLEIAKESYIKALELNSEDIYVLGVLSFLYGESEEYDKAEKLLNRGLVIAPNNPLLYLALGEMCDYRKEFNIAIDYYEKVLGFTENEVKEDFEHMNQYYHKLVHYFPDSLVKAKDEAKKLLKKDYKRTKQKTT